MPSNLFEYHTMGLSPVGPEEPDESCRVSSNQEKCSSYWLANKCVVNYSPGQGITSVQCPPKITNPPPTGGTGPLCNPSSVGRRFSFNFPSGKKWTLSKAEDARARAFYCGGGPVVNPQPDPYPVMDRIYCTGGEGAYDGAPTYWESNARKGCKTNNEGESKPYGQMISREEYDRRGRTLCADGTYDENINPRAIKCQANGGVMGSQPPQPPQPPQLPTQAGVQPPMREINTGRLFCSTGYVLQGDMCYPQPRIAPQPNMVCGGYLGWDGNSVFTQPNNKGEMIAWYIGGRCSPINEVRTGVPMR